MASKKAVCEFCGEEFANSLQLGPHKKYCWSASFGYQSSTSFTNSDSDSSMQADSESEADSSMSEAVSRSPAASRSPENNAMLQRNSLVSLAQRHTSWGVKTRVPCNSNKQYLPSRTHDFTPVSC